MRKTVALPVALALASSSAIAAQSADIQVTGTLLPPSCGVMLTDGSFDLGDISSNGLAHDTATELAPVAGQVLAVNCSGLTSIAFKITDNREDSVPASPGTSNSPNADTRQYGLGKDDQLTPIGNYVIEMVAATMKADGGPGYHKYSDDDGATWHLNGLDTIVPYNLSGNIYSIDGSNTPGSFPIQNFSTELRVTPMIEPLNKLDNTDNILIDGSATIELIYQ